MRRGNIQSTTPPVEALVCLLEAAPISAKLGAQEIDALNKVSFSEIQYPADSIIIEQGARIRNIHLVCSGWGCVYRDLANGKRQIIDFPMRCDFVGLRTADGYSYNTI